MAQSTTPIKPSVRRKLAFILLTALALRFAVLAMTTTMGIRIADEAHYATLAASLVEGRGFAFESGPTSLRPPAYPALVAAVWWAAEAQNLQLVRAVQALLGVATALMVYLVGRKLYDDTVGLIGAAIIGFYPALVYAGALLLTETLFTFLLIAALLAVVDLVERPRPVIAFVAGLLLGVSALTRSIVWPFPFLLAPLLALTLPTMWRRRATCAALILAGHVAVIAPWAMRNTRLQRVTVVVDTMGGMNLRMGNYAFTPHDRIWDAVSLEGAKSWIAGLPSHPPDGGNWTEGWKERWAREQAISFMRDHPGLTAWRSMIKFGDFWGLDRDFMAGVQQGVFKPPVWAAAVVIAAITVAFPILLGLAILGASRVPPANWRAHAVLLLTVAFVTALHSIVFGHPRYRLPLTPVLAVYAAAAISARAWRPAASRRALWLPTAVGLLFVGIWTTQFVARDWPYVRRLLAEGMP